MNIRFYIDPETELPHIYNHNVNEREVYQVLANSGEDRRAKEGSRSVIGRSDSGRFIRVIYVPDPVPDSVFVITAYELKGKPLTAFKRRIKKKGKK